MLQKCRKMKSGVFNGLACSASEDDSQAAGATWLQV